MRVFVTGATGWVGSAVVQELVGAGHQVIGLVRSNEKEQQLKAARAKPLRGSLSDVETLKRGATGADGVIHLAFGTDLSRFAESAEEDRRAIEAFGNFYQGSDRSIIVTGGLGLLPSGKSFDQKKTRPNSTSTRASDSGHR